MENEKFLSELKSKISGDKFVSDLSPRKFTENQSLVEL